MLSSRDGLNQGIIAARSGFAVNHVSELKTGQNMRFLNARLPMQSISLFHFPHRVQAFSSCTLNLQPLSPAGTCSLSIHSPQSSTTSAQSPSKTLPSTPLLMPLSPSTERDKVMLASFA